MTTFAAILSIALAFATARTALCFAAGGPPAGAGGPPRGGPPPGVAGRGPPGGGPAAGTAGTAAPAGVEAFFEKAWPVLYAFDSDARVRDGSKNLRVLWTRALLSGLGRIDDPVAYDLLPRGTRRIVGPVAARVLWGSPPASPAVEKLDWIVDRTNFIDTQLGAFLEETAGSERRQVIVLGAGYDTRSIRFGRDGLEFFEVDLPDISSAKESMLKRYFSDRQDGDVAAGPTHVGFDLNEIATQKRSLVERLAEDGLALDESVPTMVICEAVLFYLMPEAAQGLVKELFAMPNAQRYCFTDNLAKVGTYLYSKMTRIVCIFSWLMLLDST